MTETSTLTVRLDENLLAQVDKIVAYMKATTSHLGMKPTRSDAVRLCITTWLADHGDTLP